MLIISYDTQRRHTKLFEPSKTTVGNCCDLLICDEVRAVLDFTELRIPCTLPCTHLVKRDYTETTRGWMMYHTVF